MSQETQELTPKHIREHQPMDVSGVVLALGSLLGLIAFILASNLIVKTNDFMMEILVGAAYVSIGIIVSALVRYRAWVRAYVARNRVGYDLAFTLGEDGKCTHQFLTPQERLSFFSRPQKVTVVVPLGGRHRMSVIYASCVSELQIGWKTEVYVQNDQISLRLHDLRKKGDVVTLPWKEALRVLYQHPNGYLNEVIKTAAHAIKQDLDCLDLDPINLEPRFQLRLIK